MGFEFRSKLPTSAEIREQIPLPESLAKIKAERDEEIKAIFRGDRVRRIIRIQYSSTAIVSRRLRTRCRIRS